MEPFYLYFFKYRNRIDFSNNKIVLAGMSEKSKEKKIAERCDKGFCHKKP